MAYSFGKKSTEALYTCDRDLQLIATTAIKTCPVDFGISEGHRSTEKQYQYFIQGKSKIDGETKKGKHNYNPSKAFDFYPFVEGQANYEREHVTYVAGYLTAIADVLFEQGFITHKLRWGGNWDMDGTILIDQSFDDRPHVELIQVKP